MDGRFEEIRPAPAEDARPLWAQALVVNIDPKECSKLVRWLSQKLPLDAKIEGILNLSHLKRVRKPDITKSQNDSISSTLESNEGTNDNQPKKKKAKLQIQVLIGDAELQKPSNDAAISDTCESIQNEYGEFEVVKVPGRPAQSQDECRHFNTVWPTSFFPLQSLEHREKQRILTDSDKDTMQIDMVQLLKNLDEIKEPCAIVVDPESNTIVATSWQERAQQGSVVMRNPLSSPVLLALQGVSRSERDTAIEASQGTPPSSSSSRYLCNGYDIFVSYEPTVFESMACVHARLRRSIFVEDGEPPQRSVWTRGCSKHSVHCLPGTNHSYRAFKYCSKDT